MITVARFLALAHDLRVFICKPCDSYSFISILSPKIEDSRVLSLIRGGEQ